MLLFSLPVGMHVKDSHFDCEWTDSDDASLLRGVYKYGTGSWEAIKMDPELNLAQVFQ
jgi:chromodomain-helicase-DNA-binding protein 1